ncbi:NACHT domain-containing protein [Calothrix sp. 336/3]|uniref:NACHT domain-containing protein n=1 Tax=Calothrix sp. 336/3 TaxID=1337936 RepID=UPI0004E3284D|nr:NACHT domain-containing protein [Calothrix sp. 336/3]AKG20747.1 hypothetical protein IJ00_04970 [Calothrix sp. 336/3]
MKKLLKNKVFLGICAAIATIVIGYIINQLPALKDILQAKNTQELAAILSKDGNGIAIAGLLIFALLTIWVTWQQLIQEPEDAPANIDPTIRPRLLDAEETKVKQRLRDSLHNLLMLDLLHEEQPQQVGRNPLQTLYTITANNTTSQPQALARVVDVLRRSDISGRLLILGKPGGGKTTTLLNLAEELLDKAKQNPSEPMPIIFELSAWRDDSVNILDWMIGQLKQEYNLAPGISRIWLEQGEILPLLDGLDELGSVKQRKCIQAINQYLAQDATRDLVVCCREEEYHQGEEQLSQLHGAICLQELSDGQIRDYLNQLNRGDLWQSIQSNHEFLELARTPLLLSIMLVAYQGRAIQTKEELFDAYIERRFELLPVGKGEFSRPQIMQFLKFLAQRLRGTKTEFLIENMQPIWLKNYRQRLIYGLIIGLIIGLIFKLIGALIIGLIVGLVFGLITGQGRIEPIEEIQFSLTPKSRKILIYGLIYGLITGLIASPILGLILGLGLIGGMALGMTVGLIGGLITGVILGQTGKIPNKLIPNQGIRNSAKNMLFLTIVSGLILTLIQPGLKLLLLKIITAEEVNRIINLSQGLVFINAFLNGGGDVCLQHFSLRLVLWYNRYIPWNYAKFLSRAAERRFIQQIGGRYRFIHRLLLEHFADMRV